MRPSEPTELPSQYSPAEAEGSRYAHWEKAGYFTATSSSQPGTSDKPPFCVVIPPPNVTGVLHIGHALDHTIIDGVIRRRRMQGYNTLWLPGMDHAGIATQNVVERELAKEGLSRHDLGRDAFVDRVWQWKAESGGQILGQMRRLGDSVDWTRERFTMDEGLSRAVQTIFKRLYDDGLIYRAERIINWCPRCLTALSDIEVDHTDDDGELISIRYGDGDDAIVVATTRAETMLGDTAVAVHPADRRYADMVGKTVQLPLTGRRIPVIADEHVDPAFGTGAVKVTPAHDPNDFEIGQRHNLPSLTVLDEHGVITAKGPFEGLDRFEARPAVVAALRAEGRIVAEKRPYVHAVGHCSRCGTTVEPRQSLQWFVRVAPLARAAGDAVRDGRVRIHPPELAARYFAWVDDMHDWCISRQLWWGHRIPVFYGPQNDVVCLGPDDSPPDGYVQDPDVLDTWFSSALWPFSTLGWPSDTADLRTFYPTSVLVTGYDILFFWVARMMMFGLYAMDGVQPFNVVALHGLVRDQFGKKMSKSRGNTVDPLAWIDRFGADAVRFTLARGANPGGDVAISEDWAAGSRNFCNKLWNATRFALLNGARIPETPPTPAPPSVAASPSAAAPLTAAAPPSAPFAPTAPAPPSVAQNVSDIPDTPASRAEVHRLAEERWSETDHQTSEGRQTSAASAGANATGADVSYTVADRWILSRLAAVTAEVDELFEQFEFGKICETLYHFAWDEVCDWYVELAKVPLTGDDAAAASATRDVLGFVLDQLLRLLHPVMPFVTDELWTALTGQDSVMVAPWPSYTYADPAAEAEIASVMRLVTEVRRFRSDQGLKPGQRVPARLVGINGTPLAAHEQSIRALLRLSEPAATFAASAALAAEDVTVELDLAGVVDIAAERRRVEKDLAAARAEAEQTERKLANSSFTGKAPAEVVAKTRQRLEAARADIARLEQRLTSLPA